MTRALYFAYGSNMDPVQMGERCPDARAVGRASLADWEVHIGIRGFATVVDTAGSLTWGVLWEVSPADLASLDVYEGVAHGHYRRETLTAQGPESAHAALIYIEEFEGDGEPRHGYLERILDGARAFGLPDDYRAKLARLAGGE